MLSSVKSIRFSEKSGSLAASLGGDWSTLLSTKSQIPIYLNNEVMTKSKNFANNKTFCILSVYSYMLYDVPKTSRTLYTKSRSSTRRSRRKPSYGGNL